MRHNYHPPLHLDTKRRHLVFHPLNQPGLGTDGILYKLGTRFDTKEYKNPGVDGYYLEVSRSTHGGGATCVGDATAFTGREAVHSHTRSAIHSYYMIKLKQGISVKPMAYKLRSYGHGGGFMPLNWNFEASNDGNEWVTLSTHTNDRTIENFGAIGCWGVTSNRALDSFRIRSTGPDKKGDHYLCLSGFEIYGDLHM